ncbi:uncharacterized protein LOC117785821 isoform X1 [Drosophila innubila]|uniref:uncharacterized protein LOC117785821 isoform X1 n=1 Tax=Drosophila innubila TaxID=198719 RepID=UPI00148BB91C|nr:uncharacterized protein LOC117785821 isoform X1 [Drosophila innubila]
MECFLSSTCRNARKLFQLQLQKASLLQNIKFFSGKMYSTRSPTGNTSKLKTLHKQLGFLKSRALDERKEIDAKIAKLQRRIERIRDQLRKAAASKQADYKKTIQKEE